MNDLPHFLRSIGLEHYIEIFGHEDIQLQDLPLLTEPDLAEIGLPLGPRRRLLSALAGRAGVPGGTTPAASTAVTDQGERRQLTVLFCDLVGSTELSQRLDPEELSRLVRQYRDACVEAVSVFGGHVAQYLGDGVLVYFGYPQALEGGAERAIRAGLAIQSRMSALAGEAGPAQELRVRVGIDTGLVVVGAALSANDPDRTAIGEAPNVAAKLQAAAPPGTVAVSDRTRALAIGGFDWEALDAPALRSAQPSLKAWRVIAERAHDTRFEAVRGGTILPLVGRRAELDALRALWSKSREGAGSVALVSGEPGVGKSRLLRALRDLALAEGAEVWQFQCSPFYRSTALHPITSSIERRMRFGRDEPHPARLDRVSALLCGDYGMARRDAILVARVLSVDVGSPLEIEGYSPQRLKDDTTLALVAWVEAASRNRPLLFLMEDLQWADPTTLEIMTALTARVPSFRAMVMLSARPEFDPSSLPLREALPLRLDRLEGEETRELAARVAGGRELPEEIVAQILQKTDGIPLFVEELVRTILESSLLIERDGRLVLDGPFQPLAIPATLRDSLMARLDRLAPTKELAQLGACIGREFTREVLEAVSLLPARALDDALGRLCDSGLIHRRDEGWSTSYVFKHALVQEAAYESLLLSRRADLHRRIAQTLAERFPATAAAEPEVLAQHFSRAGMLGEAAGNWVAAGKLALGRMAPREAISHLEQALSCLADLPAGTARDQTELETRTLLGASWMALGGWFHPGIPQALEPALSLAQSLGRTDAAMLILWGISIQALTSGRVEESLPWADRLLDIASTANDESVTLVAQALAGIDLFWRGDLQGSTRHLDRVVSIYVPKRHGQLALLTNHDPRVVAQLYRTHMLWIQGFPDQSVEAAEELDRMATANGHPFDLGFALTLGQWAYIYRREPVTYLDKLRRCVAMATEQGLPFFSVVEPAYIRGFPLLHSGQLEAAAAQFEQGLAIRASLGGWVAFPWVLAGHAQTLLALGRTAEARKQIDSALEHIARPGWGERVHFAEVLRVQGLVSDAEGRTDHALSAYRHSIDFARGQGARSWELRTATSMAALLARCGRRGEGRAALEPVLATFTEGFESHDLVEAKGVLETLR
jgi:class 3 adenylate cyclase